MEEEVSVAALPWSWVIGYLASSELLDVGPLYELKSKAPPLLGNPGKKANDAVALRCLEGFIRPCNRLRDNRSTFHQSEIRFDPSDGCEDVLERILSETPDSDLQNASDELKSDVRSFIEHKKASLPTSTLQLLKNMIVEGTHPLAESLKEISGIKVPNQCVVSIASGGGGPPSPQSTTDENGYGGVVILSGEKRDSLRPGIDDELVQDSNDTSDDTLDDMDNHQPQGKKRKSDKQCGIQSQQQHSVSFGHNKMSNVANEEQNREHSKTKETCDGQNSYILKFGDPAIPYTEKHKQPQVSPDNGDLARKTLAFLSEDPLAGTEAEAIFCVKCNEGGQLLICDSSTCQLAFHESCLGCSASFGDQGKFYCPFCAYSRSISEYFKAKEKVSLARKELSKFIGGTTSHQKQHDLNRSSGDNRNREKENEGADKTHEPKKGADVVTQVANSPHNIRSSEDEQQEKAFGTAAPQHTSSKDRQGAETIIQLAGNKTGIQNQGQDDHGSHSGKLSHGDDKITNANQEHTEHDRKLETREHQSNKRHEYSSCESISESIGPSVIQKTKATSSLLNPTPLSSVPLTPRSKRKRVPWTSEEEAMLEEGMRRYTPKDGEAIPWREILTFGASVFNPCRRPIDLKDKWRNNLRLQSKRKSDQP